MRSSVLSASASLLLAACGSSPVGDGVLDSGPVDGGYDAPIVRDTLGADVADAADAPVDAVVPPPTASDIGFVATSPIPSGEQLLFNDWNATPNTVSSMKPDGSGAVEIFRALRVWSMGVSPGADTIAFSCADPQQFEHYGISTGDAIQNDFLYDAATQKVSLLAFGNINDECHLFSGDGEHLWVCRRYDFQTDNSFSGWRLGRFALSTKTFEFMSPEVVAYALSPQPIVAGGAETDVWYTTITGTKRAIVHRALPSGTATTVRADAEHAVFSPDGKRYVYADDKDKRALHVSALDGSGDVKITAAAGTSPVFSPDGTHVAYLNYDSVPNCQHVEVVAIDGSDLAAPKRVRDCAAAKDFVTQLAWVTRK